MNKLLKNIIVLLFLSGLSPRTTILGQSTDFGKPAKHPRLLMTQADEILIKEAVSKDRYWGMTDSLLRSGAHAALSSPVAEHVVTGRRLLEVSRETLRRILLWGYAYRMTGDAQYSDRAEKELKAVCAFKDWNPTHFLDVAEMTTAVAIGYDWFHDVYSEETKNTLKAAILEKGLSPSFESRYNDWLTRTNNWNQVCNSGMAYGALAICDERDVADLARQVLERSLESVRIPMKNYAPQGAYPEGYSYWGFGTTYNVMLIDALQKSFGTDFGLSSQEGFLQTAAFVLHMVAPDGESFNYGDNKGTGRVSPAMFWLAKHNDDHSLLWNERMLFDKGNRQKLLDYRFFALSLLWGAGIRLDSIPQPQEKVWFAPSVVTPVALMRTSWENESEGIFLGFKGGSAMASHAHLDAGSFVMVADGVRWAMDFGRQDYHSLESKGMDIWNKSQTSDRWKVFRYTNQAHNTLTFNDQLQRVEGYADIEETSDDPRFPYAISDLTPVYENQVKKVRRGVALVDGNHVVVRDEIETGDKPAKVRWTMLTPAQARNLSNNSMALSKNGRQLLMHVDSPLKVDLNTWDTVPTTDYDAENPGTQRVGFETVLPPNSHVVLQVRLIPGRGKRHYKRMEYLDLWKNRTQKKR